GRWRTEPGEGRRDARGSRLDQEPARGGGSDRRSQVRRGPREAALTLSRVTAHATECREEGRKPAQPKELRRMKLKVSLLALFVAGLIVSVAIAGPGPDKGKPPGKGNGKNGAPAVSSTSLSTSTSTTGSTTTTTTPSGKK